LKYFILTEKGRRQDTGDRRQKGKSRKLIRELEIREFRNVVDFVDPG